MILFTQSTAVLHKYLNDELKILCLLSFFPEVAQNSLRIPSFPHSEKSLSIPGFPGLWPPCFGYKAACRKCKISSRTAAVITCFRVIGPTLRSLQTMSSKCTRIFFLMKRNRCFWFIHDAAWTWVSTCQSFKPHTTVLLELPAHNAQTCSDQKCYSSDHAMCISAYFVD